MRYIISRGTRLALTATGLSLGIASLAEARAVRRIEGRLATVFFTDNDMNDGGQLAANLTLGEIVSNLDVFVATSGRYNSRLSTRCSDGRLLEISRSNVTGTTNGDVTHTCGGNTFPLRIEGAIDDL
jgi:hypothetical protein